MAPTPCPGRPKLKQRVCFKLRFTALVLCIAIAASPVALAHSGARPAWEHLIEAQSGNGCEEQQSIIILIIQNQEGEWWAWEVVGYTPKCANPASLV